MTQFVPYVFYFMNRQRICGLIGGLSYVSSLDYYDYINRRVHEYWRDHSSRIHMVSLDIYHMTLFLEGSQWSNAADYVLDGVHQLMKTDIDFLLIASNTGHIGVPRILECYPNIVLLHISDAVAFAIKEKNLRKIGFLGTKMTMKFDSCVVQRLLEHDLQIVLPNQEEIVDIHRIITWELAFNILNEQSKLTYLKIIQRLYDEDKVDGVILGCTEIPLIVKQANLPHIPLFNSAQLHAQFAVDYQLNRCEIEAYLPSNTHSK